MVIRDVQGKKCDIVLSYTLHRDASDNGIKTGKRKLLISYIGILKKSLEGKKGSFTEIQTKRGLI